MSYSILIERIFHEQRDCISETDFIEKLPKLLSSRNTKWTGDVLSDLLIQKFGLNGKQSKTHTELSKIFDVSTTMISIRSKEIFQRLRFIANVSQIVTKLTPHEKLALQNYQQEVNQWPKNLTHSAQKVLSNFNLTKEKELCTELFSEKPRIQYGQVVNPEIEDIRATNRFDRMPIKIFNEIRESLGIEPIDTEERNRKTTEKKINLAISLLEKHGYKTIPPKT